MPITETHKMFFFFWMIKIINLITFRYHGNRATNALMKILLVHKFLKMVPSLVYMIPFYICNNTILNSAITNVKTCSEQQNYFCNFV